MRGSRKFCQRGSKFDKLFWVDKGGEDLNTIISGRSSARQRNAIKMAFHWHADGGQTLNAGLVALWFSRRSGPALLRNPIFLWFFRGGGVRTPSPSPSGSAHVHLRPLHLQQWLLVHGNQLKKPGIKVLATATIHLKVSWGSSISSILCIFRRSEVKQENLMQRSQKNARGKR